MSPRTTTVVELPIRDDGSRLFAAIHYAGTTRRVPRNRPSRPVSESIHFGRHGDYIFTFVIVMRGTTLASSEIGNLGAVAPNASLTDLRSQRLTRVHRLSGPFHSASRVSREQGTIVI